MRNDEDRARSRDTASLVVQRMVTRLVQRVRAPVQTQPGLEPTIFVPLRRGAELTWKDVAERKV